jgi:hypothetical protein
LLPETLPAAALFMQVRTQWQHAPSGRPTGLRYADVMAAMPLLRRELGLKKSDQPQLFADLRAIEQAFVAATAEVMAQGKPND